MWRPAGAWARSPGPAAVRRQRLAGVAFALLGLVLATASAMNLARNAEAGHPWIPPWLVAGPGRAGAGHRGLGQIPPPQRAVPARHNRGFQRRIRRTLWQIKTL